jgi:hypothetical protein
LAAGNFDIFLNNSSNSRPAFNYLKPVFVRNSNYRNDSIKNRQEYADVFNYRKTGVGMGNNKWRDSVNGLALDTKDKKLSLLDIGGALQGASKKSRQKLHLQKMLVQTEQANYIEHTFTPALVEKYSGMHDDDSLHQFIKKYAPPYNELTGMNEIDMAMYIVKQVKLFRQGK